MSLFDELESFTSNLEQAPTKTVTKAPTYVKKKDSASERFLETISAMGYDLAELEGVLRTWGNQLVLSCAGSGKTTSTIFKLIYGIKTGKLTKKVEINGNTVRTVAKVWVSTFLNSGARELKYELSKWNKKLGYMDVSDSITFSTLHAEFKAVLNSLGVVTNFIDEKDNTKILKNIANRFGVRKNGKPLTSDDLRDLEGALTYSRNRLDAKRYSNITYKEFNLTAIEIDAIIFEWANARRASGQCDFEDLQDILYTLIYDEQRQDVIDFIADRYEFIFVDEFQDTSQKQYAILKAYMLGAKQIVAVGDDDQTIYSWRGSDHNIITHDFIEDFNPTISKLSTNFRCPANILDAIVPSIELNSNRLDKSIRAAKEGGELFIGRYHSYNDMVKGLVDGIYRDIADGMDVAVICRENIDGLLPAIMLDRDGRFSYSISGQGMTLSPYMVKQAISIIRLVTEKTSNNVANVLKQLTFNNWEINSMLSALKNNNESIWDAPMEDIEYSCPSISGVLEEWKNVHRTFKEGKITEMDFVEYLLAYYHNFVYTPRVGMKDSIYNERMRSILSTLIVLVNSGEFTSASDLLYELDEINLRLQSRLKQKNAEVKIVTVNEFKGKEIDSAYPWNVVIDVFPHKKATSQEELEEERRMFYIACTRGKKRTTIMTIVGREGMFLHEMDLSTAEELVKLGGSIGEIGGSLSGRGVEASSEARNRRKLEGMAIE